MVDGMLDQWLYVCQERGPDTPCFMIQGSDNPENTILILESPVKLLS